MLPQPKTRTMSGEWRSGDRDIGRTALTEDDSKHDWIDSGNNYI